MTRGVDTTITLGAWLASHPGDTVSLAAPTAARNDRVCRTAEHRVRIDGADVDRSAVFYIPAPQAGEPWPVDSGQFAERKCTLRSVWLVRNVADSMRVQAASDSTSHRLTPALGAGVNGSKMAGQGAGQWQHARSWSVGDTRVVLGSDPAVQYHDEGELLPTSHPWRVIVAAYAPGACLEDFDERQKDARCDDAMAQGLDSLRSGRLQAALKLADAKVAPLLQVVVARMGARGDSSWVQDAKTDSAMLHAYVFARDSTATMPAGARSATLLATDMVMHAYAANLDADTAGKARETRARFDAAHVQLGADPLGATVQYERPLLWMAWRADSLGGVGSAGHVAFVELLSEGWSTKAACGDGADQYSVVIARAEAALARGDADPVVQLYAGLAQGDLFALAHGAHAGYANDSDYKAGAEAGRVKALAHLEQALTKGLPAPARKGAWETGVKLLLKTYAQARYFCVYD
ncbi:MAG: hypothetical protein JWO05_3867 [Gemmatimonadetes bacterium]|nr:hypothetical protein [Gemmatimonadota bacterium]